MTTISASARLGFLALLAGATGIGFAPIFVRLSETGPSATAFYRVALALPVLWWWMNWEQRKPTPPLRPASRRDYWQLALAGALFATDLALWHLSILFTSVANSTLLANFAPLFVTLGARFIFGEKIRPLFVAGLVCALAGAALLVGASFQTDARHLLGDALAVAAAIFYGGYMLAIKSLRARFSSVTVMSWSGLFCAPVLGVIAWLSGEKLLAATPHGWLLLVGLALVSQVVGQTLIAYGFAHLKASFASLTLLFQPAMAALFAWGMLGERPRPLAWAGALVILLGIALAGRAQQTR